VAVVVLSKDQCIKIIELARCGVRDPDRPYEHVLRQAGVPAPSNAVGRWEGERFTRLPPSGNLEVLL
jgi:hypothetical protein